MTDREDDFKGRQFFMRKDGHDIDVTASVEAERAELRAYQGGYHPEGNLPSNAPHPPCPHGVAWMGDCHPCNPEAHAVEPEPDVDAAMLAAGFDKRIEPEQPTRKAVELRRVSRSIEATSVPHATADQVEALSNRTTNMMDVEACDHGYIDRKLCMGCAVDDERVAIAAELQRRIEVIEEHAPAGFASGITAPLSSVIDWIEAR